MIATLADWLSAEVAQRGRLVVAVDGAAGSGKSTLAEALRPRLPSSALVAMDDFVRPLREQRPYAYAPRRGAEHLRLRELQRDVLTPLRQGRAARYRPLDWTRDRLDRPRSIAPAALVILEGVYAGSARLRPWVDVRIWAGLPPRDQLRRIVARDGPRLLPFWRAIWLPAERAYFTSERPWRTADVCLSGPTSRR